MFFNTIDIFTRYLKRRKSDIWNRHSLLVKHFLGKLNKVQPVVRLSKFVFLVHQNFYGGRKTLVAGITLLEGTIHSFVYMLALGLTHSNIKTHTGLQQKQIRGIVVQLIAKKQIKIYCWLFPCCRWTWG